MSIVFAALLAVVLAGFWVLTVLGLPGNWGMVVATGLFAWLVPQDSAVTLGWTTVIVLAVLAGIGELLEFLAGAIGVSSAKGSKRSAVLAIVFSILGSFLGVAIGAPLPVIGPFVAIILCSGAGAMVGAIIGELWKGRANGEAIQVGRAAVWDGFSGPSRKSSSARRWSPWPSGR